MAEVSAIAWTKSTFNPWIGCTKVGPGCDHCYAEALDKRHRWKGAEHWGPGVPRMRTAPSNWRLPLRWNEQAKASGEFWPVFCASLADVFDNEVDEAWRSDLWDLIANTPYLTWQLVTKRVGNVCRMVPAGWLDHWRPNVWIIGTMVDQEEFDRDWPKLREIPAAVRGLSIEPMLGPIWFPEEVRGLLHWAIYGGESQQGGIPRNCDIRWIEGGVKQCRALGIAPFVKQLGTHAYHPRGGVPGRGKRADPADWPEALRVQEFPDTRTTATHGGSNG